MNLFRNVVFIAAIAGLCAGLVLMVLQSYSTVPIIQQAETYENAGGVSPGTSTVRIRARP